MKPSDLDRSEWLRLYWGFVWRGACVGVLATLTRTATGFVLGFTAAALVTAAGVCPEPYRVPVVIASGILGLAMGLVFAAFYIRWLFRARFRSLRLALVKDGGDVVGF